MHQQWSSISRDARADIAFSPFSDPSHTSFEGLFGGARPSAGHTSPAKVSPWRGRDPQLLLSTNPVTRRYANPSFAEHRPPDSRRRPPPAQVKSNQGPRLAVDVLRLLLPRILTLTCCHRRSFSSSASILHLVFPRKLQIVTTNRHDAVSSPAIENPQGSGPSWRQRKTPFLIAICTPISLLTYTADHCLCASLLSYSFPWRGQQGLSFSL